MSLDVSVGSSRRPVALLTRLVVLLLTDTQHINIFALHLPEDDYKVYLSITGR